MKLVRDKFRTRDGVVHIENSRRIVTQAICGRWSSPHLAEWVDDDVKVTCIGCLAAENPHDVRP